MPIIMALEPAGSLPGDRTERDAPILTGVRLVMIADAGETTARMTELGELDLALDDLGQLFAVENDRARLALEGLEEDGADLHRLDGMLARWRGEVDVFDALRLHGDEQFHSNLLAWLLDPRGSHGLGDLFLRRFLAAGGASRAIGAADVPSTMVRREKSLEFHGEYGRLDIWMLNMDANFVCAIENKVWAPESGDQLAWYRKVLACDHPGQRVHRVFLTPRGVPPDDPEEREHWVTMSYADILRLFEETTAAAGDAANEDVLALLRQYAITLRRNIVPEVSNDVHELARRIYRKHRQAIDLIIEHRERYEPNYVTEWFWMSREAIAGQPLWREAACNRPYARFVAADWDEYTELELADWPNSLLLFELHATPSGLELYFSLAGGGDEQLRRRIFNAVKTNSEVFDCEAPAYSDGFIRLHTVGMMLHEGDREMWWDEAGTGKTIAGRLEDFAQSGFPAINGIIVDCLEDYRAEQG